MFLARTFLQRMSRFSGLSLALALGLLLPGENFGEEIPARRVLAIGIDGLRPDSLAAAKTPHLDALIADGAYSDTTQILGERYQKNDTISGPGWSSYVTGVWADKHGVHDNSFSGKNYKEFPHFFVLLKRQFPQARTGSFIDWAPLDTHAVEAADVRKVYPATGADGYTEMDAVIAKDASKFLAEDNPHAAMVYFGSVDETGHRYGFHPTVEEYIQAIERVDTHVGRLMDALRSRPRNESEDWLVVVSTDHGGKGRSHGSGHNVPEIRTTFLIVSGQAAQQGKLEVQTYVVDLPVTALKHLGVDLKPEWKLDGRPVGLRESASVK